MDEIDDARGASSDRKLAALVLESSAMSSASALIADRAGDPASSLR